MKRKTEQPGTVVSKAIPREGNSCPGPVFPLLHQRIEVIGANTHSQSGSAFMRILVSIATTSVILTLVWKSLQSVPVHSSPEATSFSTTAKTLVAKPVIPHPILPIVVKGQSRQNSVILNSVHDALYSKNTAWDARLRHINNLGRNLAVSDIAILLDYVKNPNPDDGLNAAHRRAFVNDIIYALRIQNATVAELTEVFANIYSDKQRDAGIRDYAIQHLSEWRWKAVQTTPFAANQIDKTLWAAAQEVNQSFSGTALLALQRLVDDAEMPDHDIYADHYKQRLAETALAIATSDKAPLAARITGLGICSHNNPQEAGTIAVRILASPTSPNSLQLAALGALIKALPADSALKPEAIAIIQHAAESGYPPVQQLAATTLRNHTF